MLTGGYIPIHYIFDKIKYDMGLVLFVGLFTHYMTLEFGAYMPEMPLSIPAFLGTAISVLLSFKMNQSYDRWWEARKVWGAVVNDSRSLVIQFQTLIGKNHQELIKIMAYRQMAWCYSLGNSLRGLNPMEDIEKFMSKEDIQKISSHSNKPLAIMQLNAADVSRLKEKMEIDVFRQLQIDRTFVRLVDAMGKAERINNTVFPATYRYFLHFIIYVFVITLSISLKEFKLQFELSLLMITSAGFFLIEKSAYHLQDPFKNRPSDVSVTAIARTIEINIRQLLGEREVPAPLAPKDFYIM
jgi:ion channel-forming bestrophin family protein